MLLSASIAVVHEEGGSGDVCDLRIELNQTYGFILVYSPRAKEQSHRHRTLPRSVIACQNDGCNAVLLE